MNSRHIVPVAALLAVLLSSCGAKPGSEGARQEQTPASFAGDAATDLTADIAPTNTGDIEARTKFAKALSESWGLNGYVRCRYSIALSYRLFTKLRLKDTAAGLKEAYGLVEDVRRFANPSPDEALVQAAIETYAAAHKDDPFDVIGDNLTKCRIEMEQVENSVS